VEQKTKKWKKVQKVKTELLRSIAEEKERYNEKELQKREVLSME